MSIVGGMDIHRKQLTFDWVDEQTGRWERGRIAPADREHLADWLTRFADADADAGGAGEVGFALEGCTGWRYVAEEMTRAGVVPHLAEPADTSALRGPKRRAKTDKADAKLARGGPRRSILGSLRPAISERWPHWRPRRDWLRSG